jgi:hypothetical protein
LEFAPDEEMESFSVSRVASASKQARLTLAKAQLLMEGVTLDRGRRPLQMFVRSFQIWDQERQAT